MADTGLFELLAEPYLVLDGDLVPVAANRAWRSLFDTRRDHSPGKTMSWADLDPRHEELVRSISSELRGGEHCRSSVIRLDHEADTEGGSCQRPRDWQVFASVIPARGLEPRLITLRYDDVTARELAALTPVQSVIDGPTRQTNDTGDAELDATLALAGLGVWRLEVATGSVRCNEPCLLHLGVSRSADVTREWLLDGLPDRIEANPGAHGGQRSFECERQSPDGCHWVLVHGICRFNKDGTMRSVTGFTLDLTSRKQHEIELDALANSERSARERSEAVARTMDQFIAAVSHELRSPLNAIVSWAELLKLAMDPANVVRAGEAIRRNGRQLSHMVDDLLDSGAIATGKLSVKLQPVDLGALAAIVAEDVRKLAQHKGLQLQAVDISPCLVMADESRIKQVIWNLLANAVKFTDAGDVEISVKATQDCAEMRVRDTGRGIAPDALSLVFDRFQQIGPQSSGRVGGLGLGLWLAKHIVGLHGGSIDVASDGPGCGATFTVTLALASAG
ncbi:sensor histidine kinase [Paraburkholderia sp. BCC1886]|uniref:sensor histidine kinase n=1 Tax=Paraburkholderia sp. BCC1886 TaxID=2562670 RepID=UPI0011832E2D|nr:HAMP domain-containing sensor histidine kinase [Paraburkholderia sp. BCC1886]